MGIKVTKRHGRHAAHCACGYVSKASVKPGPAQVRASLHLATAHHIKPQPMPTTAPADQLALGL